jgi:two-component system sensor histidine kinase TctE
LKIRFDTLRRQLVVWLAVPAGSAVVDQHVRRLRHRQPVRDVGLRPLAARFRDRHRQADQGEDGRIQADLPEVVLEMLVTGEPGKFFYLITGPQGEFIAGTATSRRRRNPTPDKATYYDAEFQGKPLRLAALACRSRATATRAWCWCRSPRPITARTDYARQIMLRMMLPQVVLILLAALAVWYAVGRGSRRSPRCSAKSPTAPTATSPRCPKRDPERGAPADPRDERAARTLVARARRAAALHRRRRSPAAHAPCPA